MAEDTALEALKAQSFFTQCPEAVGIFGKWEEGEHRYMEGFQAWCVLEQMRKIVLYCPLIFFFLCRLTQPFLAPCPSALLAWFMRGRRRAPRRLAQSPPAGEVHNTARYIHMLAPGHSGWKSPGCHISAARTLHSISCSVPVTNGDRTRVTNVDTKACGNQL